MKTWAIIINGKTHNTATTESAETVESALTKAILTHIRHNKSRKTTVDEIYKITIIKEK